MSDSPESRVSAMAIYKPSPALSGGPHPPRIAVVSRSTALRILCSQTGTELAALDGPEPQKAVTIHYRPDGRPVIVTRSELNYVWAWDGDDYHLVFKRSLGAGLRFQHLYTYAEPEEGRLRVIAVERLHLPSLFVLDGDTGGTLHRLALDDQMHCVGGYVWSDGEDFRQRFVAAGTTGQVLVIDPEAGQILRKMQDHRNYNVVLACFESDESPPVPYVVVACESDDHKVQVSS
jgi:WD40 repeat protein